MTKKVKSKKETNLYMINCISMHRIRYCVEMDQETLDNLNEEIERDGANELIEFSQEYLGEKLVSIELIPDKDAYLKVFNKDNAYLGRWSDEKKMEMINKKFKK